MTARPLRIVFLGLSITSSWGNGHATNYRGLVRALSERGHDVLFLERDMPWYAAHRDLPEPAWGRTELYESLEELPARFAGAVAEADLTVVGSFVPDGIAVGEWVTRTAGGATAFYDLDTPVTLAAVELGNCAYLSRSLVPRFDLYLSFTGGPTLERLADGYGAARPRAFHCFVDPELYLPQELGHALALTYLGTYSEDRQPALERLLLEPARRLERERFAVGGPLYPPEVAWPPNVERTEHVPPPEHAAFYGRGRFTLNVTRAEMAGAGWSPSVRLFEAAACAVPVISDPWPGLDTFFEPGRELLVAGDTEDVLRHLGMGEAERRPIAERARERVLAEHTAGARARELEWLLSEMMENRRP